MTLWPLFCKCRQWHLDGRTAVSTEISHARERCIFENDDGILEERHFGGSTVVFVVSRSDILLKDDLDIKAKKP